MSDGTSAPPDHSERRHRSTSAFTARGSYVWVPAAVLVLLGIAAFAVLYYAAVLTHTGQSWDNHWMARAVPETFEMRQRLRKLHSSFGPTPLAIACGALALVGLRRGPATSLAVLVSTGLCAVASQLLKEWLERPQLADPWPMGNSLPSGHVAGIAAVGVAALLVAPRAVRPLLSVLGLLATAAMGVVVVMLEHHRPSDVLASVCVAMVALGIGWVIRDPDLDRDF